MIIILNERMRNGLSPMGVGSCIFPFISGSEVSDCPGSEVSGNPAPKRRVGARPLE